MTSLNVLRILHVAAGAGALLVAPVAMFAPKWGAVHRNSGRVYTWAMVAVVISSLVLAIVTGKTFLFVTGVFSGYLAVSGWRTVLRRGKPGGAIDWTLLGLFALSGVAMAFLATRADPGTRPILITFALIIGGFAFRQSMTLPKAVAIHVWIPLHLASMCASYIAALTAFSATQLAFIHPIWLQWLWPTAIGVPLIVWTSLRWKLRLRAKN